MIKADNLTVGYTLLSSGEGIAQTPKYETFASIDNLFGLLMKSIMLLLIWYFTVTFVYNIFSMLHCI